MMDNLLREQPNIYYFANSARNDVIPYPPKAEQKAITAVLCDLDAAIAWTETKLTKARQIKQGMMQELLTGRIRLV